MSGPPRKSRVYSPSVLLNVLRIVWCTVVVWCEIGVYFYSAATCTWPDKSLVIAANSERPVRVLLIADAQVRNPALASTLGWSYSALRHYILDLSLKKSWNMVSRRQPDMVIFLGDMLASGRLVMSEAEYKIYVNKFRDTFPLNRWVDGSSVPIYYIPGNNDVGLGHSAYFDKDAHRRFKKYFGPLNQKLHVGNHTLVLLDAAGLGDEDYQRTAQGVGYDSWTPLRGGPIEFIESAEQDHEYPKILFTHIPLARPERASCGPLREKGTIRRGVGPGYQNTFGKETTHFLLDTLQPITVFSADNRDYCDYTHVLPPAMNPSGNDTYIREVTVKSFSLAKNIHRPGYHLLSLLRPSSISPPSTIADSTCALPNQLAINTSVYIPLTALTFIIVFISELYFHRTRRLHSRHLTAPNLYISPVPYVDPEASSSYFSLSPYGAPPESAVWSPSSPGGPRSSPHSPLPTMRTPASAAPSGLGGLFRPAPTLRAAQSRSGTPLISSTHPTFLVPHAEDEEDMINLPMQHTNGNAGMNHVMEYADHDHHESENTYFLPAAEAKTASRATSGWSWSFVLFGRRRRMTLHIPPLRSIVSALLVFTSGEMWDRWRNQKSVAPRRRSRGVARAVLLDACAVGWSVMGFWVMLSWLTNWVL